MIATLKKEHCDMDLGCYSDGENTSTPKRSLDVDLMFPTKMMSPSTQEVSQTLVKQEEETEEEEEEEEEEDDDDNDMVLSQSLRQREKNIQENKAMLAKLLSELTPFYTPQKKKQTRENNVTPRKPRFKPEIVIRRNPPRKGRPVLNFGVEEKTARPGSFLDGRGRGAAKDAAKRTRPPSEKSVSPGWGEQGARMTDIKRLVEVDEEYVSKKRYIVRQLCPSVVRSVEEITKRDLDNIAYCRQDKIRNKMGTYCHQCRQNTLDTKTSCRSGVCEGVKGQVCGLCLKSRYGEDVRTALLDPTWSCPKCRGICNCSRCRRKEGRHPTGVLVDLAGHNNVHEYLQWIQNQQAPSA